MLRKRIVARDYRGFALVRFIVRIIGETVYITDSARAANPPSVGFPLNDIFKYSLGIKDGETEVNWSEMTPLKASA